MVKLFNTIQDNWLGVNLKCNDDHATQKWANDSKLHIFANTGPSRVGFSVCFQFISLTTMLNPTDDILLAKATFYLEQQVFVHG